MSSVIRRSRRVQTGRARSRRTRHQQALRRPAAGDRGRPRRPRRPRPVADRVGQDPRLRRADRRSDRGRRPAPGGARSSPRPASSPARSSTSSRRSPGPATCASPPSTAASASARRSSAPRRPTSSSPPPAGSRTCSSAARSASARFGCSSSTRPTGCSTWASSPPSTGSSPAPRATARPCSSRRRWRGRPASSPPPTPTMPAATCTPRRRRGARRSPTASSTSTPRAPSFRRWSTSCATTERGRTLVFVRTKRGADRLVKRLGAKEVRAVAMHGNKTQSQRERALARFERGDVDTLVATDVAARGIDVADITHVINFDAPADRDAYVHRVGRTGRAGRTGAGISFVLADQAGRDAPDRQATRARPGVRPQSLGLVRPVPW